MVMLEGKRTGLNHSWIATNINCESAGTKSIRKNELPWHKDNMHSPLTHSFVSFLNKFGSRMNHKCFLLTHYII